MPQKNKPIWVQVAEAGFGDMLEARGWRQVSPAHWRLDRKGLVWRVVLDKPPSWDTVMKDTSGGFRDETGLEVVGLDDLIKKVDPSDRERWFFPMIRRSIRAHDLWSVWELHSYAEERKISAEEDASRTWWSSIKESLMLHSTPRIQTLDESEPTIVNVFRGTWWNAKDFDADYVSARLSYWWQEIILPWVDQYPTAEEYIRNRWTEEDPDKQNSSPIDIYCNYLMGNFEYCQRRLRAEANRHILTVEEELKRLNRMRFFDSYPPENRTPEARLETAAGFIEYETFLAEFARKKARVLNLDID